MRGTSLHSTLRASAYLREISELGGAWPGVGGEIRPLGARLGAAVPAGGRWRSGQAGPRPLEAGGAPARAETRSVQEAGALAPARHPSSADAICPFAPLRAFNPRGVVGPWGGFLTEAGQTDGPAEKAQMHRTVV